MVVARHPSLNWCRPLSFLEVVPANGTAVAPKLMHTFPGHFVKPKSFRRLNRRPTIATSTASKPATTTAAPTITTARLDADFVDYNEIETQLLQYDPPYSRAQRKSEAEKERLATAAALAKSEAAKENVSGLTALVSFPGSGNTWLRYLLQQSTGENVFLDANCFHYLA